MPATFDEICEGLRSCGIDGLEKVAERVARSERTTLDVPVQFGLTEGPDQELVFDRKKGIRSRLVFDEDGLLDPDASEFNRLSCPCRGCPARFDADDMAAFEAHLDEMADALAPDQSDEGEHAQMIRAHEAAAERRDSRQIKRDAARRGWGGR